MEISKPLQNLIKQAQSISTPGAANYHTLSATIITPTQQIPTYLVSGVSTTSMFGTARADDIRITCQIQPGLYLKQVIPYSDDLMLEIIYRQGIKQVAKKFRCIPLVTEDPEKAGNDTKTSNLEGFDNLNLITINLQLQEPGYAILRNAFAPDPVFLMAKPGDALKHSLITAGNEAGLTGVDAFKGVDMPVAFDNTKIYKHIEVADGMRLMELANYLQNDDRYGIYSTGIGCFYRKGMFYVQPLFLMGRYATAPRVVDIYRLPQDAVPTLESTWYYNDKTLSILSTGESKHTNKVDIERQNKGVGKRVINPDAISGKAGYYYDKGKAITTRSDSLSEYQTASRASGEQISTYDRNPAENVYKALSDTSFNDGELLTVPWDNSQADLITPFMPCKYFYTQNNDVLVEREGIIIGVVSGSVKNDTAVKPSFKENAKLFLFLVNPANSQT